LKWALLGVCYTVIALPLDPVVGANGLLYATGLIALPVAMGVAMSRYRLYAVDLVINRALRYGALLVLLAGVYVLVLSAIDAIAHQWGAPVVSAAATGVAALSLMPLYLWVRRIANRITFGIREEPRQVLRRVGGLLTTASASGGVLPLVAADLARALRLRFVSIEVRAGDGYRIVATSGTPTGEQAHVPLRYQGEDVGRLGFAGRMPHGGLPPGDRQTLTDLAPQIAAAVAATRLTEQLQRSANRLISARAAERARIRRDLHDGLGPTLAAIGIQAELARELITTDASGSAQVLTELKQHSAAGVAEVRRIVDDLRPSALERGGLLDALTSCALALSTPPIAQAPTTEAPAAHSTPPDPAPPGPAGTALSMLVHGDGDLESLPPEVEVAAYRVAVEAMTNAARHSRASRVDTSITLCEGVLTVQTTDDGSGLPPHVRAGTGLESMRRRARDLGGTCIVSPGPDGTGTQVTARILVSPT
jgi:signal transduction histidine kinase